MPLSHTLHAHCPICGNLELKRISPEHVNSPLRFLWRLLRVPAFRCEPCRYKFFSILPMRELQPEEEAVRVSSAD
jgi:C4-type Zn-finger protein